MNSKEKAIELAYGDKYDWDENGWLMYGVDENSEYGYEPFGEYEKRNEVDGSFEWRPISLQGIETNNGWIKIESENDLPSENTDCWFMVNNLSWLGYYSKRGFFCNGGEDIELKFVTHYQPIIKPNNPIY